MLRDLNDPFTYDDHRTIDEVFGNLTPDQEMAAWAAIKVRCRETSGRFYAYTTACQIGAAAKRGETNA